MINKLFKIINLLLIIILINSCNKDTPSIVFFPDMYYAVAYDPYQEAVQPYISNDNTVPLFKKMNGKTVLLPVKGAVSRNIEGILPIEFENNLEGYEKSKKIIFSPFYKDKNIKKRIEKGQYLYEQNCIICHGPNGNGDGLIVQNGSYAGVPKYSDRELSIGSIHYVITYGKNIMGSYANNMTPADRWYLAEYIMNILKKK